MSIFVVDASLVVKWFVPEIHSEAAQRWLDAAHDYVAPDLLFPEVGNVLWKKVRHKELEERDARQLIVDVAHVAIETVATRNVLEDALALALAAGVTVYDAIYLTLAIRLDTALITGDQRFVDTIAAHPVLIPHIRRLQDFSE